MFDVDDARGVLRLGPFRRFRDDLRKLAVLQPSRAAEAKAQAEAVLLALNAVDAALLRLDGKQAAVRAAAAPATGPAPSASEPQLAEADAAVELAAVAKALLEAARLLQAFIDDGSAVFAPYMRDSSATS